MDKQWCVSPVEYYMAMTMISLHYMLLIEWSQTQKHVCGQAQDHVAFLYSLQVRNSPAILGFDLWVRRILWRRKRQPTPVFLPGRSHRQRSLVGYSSWGYKESDTTEHTNALRN